MLMAKSNADKALELIAQLEATLVQNDEQMHSTTLSGAEIHSILDGFVALYPKVSVNFLCSHMVTIHTDGGLLKRILDNCISNAFRAGRSDWVLLCCECDDDLLQIHVKDGGVGMDKKQLDRIGLGFSTTGGGDGTKILIDLLVRTGGTIKWASIKDVGTCVTITFKLSVP